MHKALPLLAVAALLLAGCAGSATQTTGAVSHTLITKGGKGTTSTPTPGASAAPPATTSPSSSPSSSSSSASASPPADDGSPRMSIHGVVVDEALRPLRANVTILETGAKQSTGAGGAFRFEDLRPDVYFLTARSAGFRPQTLSVTPAGAHEPLKFQLQAIPSDTAFNETVRFRGTFECALEVLIVSPSCDSLVTSEDGLNRPDLGLFNSTNTVTVDVQDGWKTVVVDVVFDGAAQPLLNGLRVTVQGSHDQTGLGTYEQYGRFNGVESFTFRIEPGATYPDGTAGEVPHNTTAFRFQAFPQSHAWHTVCSPDGATCFLGVGAGADVQFQLYVTTFYGKPAPAGFTLGEA